jgi:hypothetical protein
MGHCWLSLADLRPARPAIVRDPLARAKGLGNYGRNFGK